MGYFNTELDQWITSEKHEDETWRQQAAVAYMKAGADRVDRPIDHAAGDETDPTKKAARQAFELNRAGVDPKHLATLFALHRHNADGDPTDPGDAAATNRDAVDELASRFDDEVEARYEYDDGQETANAYEWLYEEHGFTPEQLAAKVDALSEAEGHALLKMFSDQYAEARDNGYADPDAGGYSEDDYADDGTDYDGGDAAADGADWQ